MEILDGEAREIIDLGNHAKSTIDEVRDFLGKKPTITLGPRKKKQLLILLDNAKSAIAELEDYLGV